MFRLAVFASALIAVSPVAASPSLSEVLETTEDICRTAGMLGQEQVAAVSAASAALLRNVATTSAAAMTDPAAKTKAEVSNRIFKETHPHLLASSRSLNRRMTELQRLCQSLE